MVCLQISVIFVLTVLNKAYAEPAYRPHGSSISTSLGSTPNPTLLSYLMSASDGKSNPLACYNPATTPYGSAELNPKSLYSNYLQASKALGSASPSFPGQSLSYPAKARLLSKIKLFKTLLPTVLPYLNRNLNPSPFAEQQTLAPPPVQTPISTFVPMPYALPAVNPTVFKQLLPALWSDLSRIIASKIYSTESPSLLPKSTSAPTAPAIPTINPTLLKTVFSTLNAAVTPVAAQTASVPSSLPSYLPFNFDSSLLSTLSNQLSAALSSAPTFSQSSTPSSDSNFFNQLISSITARSNQPNPAKLLSPSQCATSIPSSISAPPPPTTSGLNTDIYNLFAQLASAQTPQKSSPCSQTPTQGVPVTSAPLSTPSPATYKQSEADQNLIKLISSLQLASTQTPSQNLPSPVPRQPSITPPPNTKPCSYTNELPSSLPLPPSSCANSDLSNMLSTLLSQTSTPSKDKCSPSTPPQATIPNQFSDFTSNPTQISQPMSLTPLCSSPTEKSDFSEILSNYTSQMSAPTTDTYSSSMFQSALSPLFTSNQCSDSSLQSIPVSQSLPLAFSSTNPEWSNGPTNIQQPSNNDCQSSFPEKSLPSLSDPVATVSSPPNSNIPSIFKSQSELQKFLLNLPSLPLPTSAQTPSSVSESTECCKAVAQPIPVPLPVSPLPLGSQSTDDTNLLKFISSLSSPKSTSLQYPSDSPVSSPKEASEVYCSDSKSEQLSSSNSFAPSQFNSGFTSINSDYTQNYPSSQNEYSPSTDNARQCPKPSLNADQFKSSTPNHNLINLSRSSSSSISGSKYDFNINNL